jgi:WD40 repeat protein
VVISVAFSPDGNKIVSGSRDKTIRLWDTSGNPIGQPFKGLKADVTQWHLARRQNIVSGSADKMIRLWGTKGNPIGQPFKGHEVAVISEAF